MAHESRHAWLQASYGTQQAIALAQDLEKNSDAVLSASIQKDGAISVSGVQISDKIVQVLSSFPHLRGAVPNWRADLTQDATTNWPALVATSKTRPHLAAGRVHAEAPPDTTPLRKHVINPY